MDTREQEPMARHAQLEADGMPEYLRAFDGDVDAYMADLIAAIIRNQQALPGTTWAHDAGGGG